MSGVRVNDGAARRRLQGMKRRSLDYTPALEWARRELAEANRNNFRANGTPSGGWPPLDPEYREWKREEFPGTGPLVRGGELLGELSTLTGPPNFVGRTNATFGTDLPYAKFHEHGTRFMPRREIIFIPPLFAERLAEKAAEHIVSGGVRFDEARRMFR